MALRGLHKIKEQNEKKKLQPESKSLWIRTTKYMTSKNQLFWWLYEGQTVNDKNHGYGILTKVYNQGEMKKSYAGHWRNGKKEGLGGYWYDSGSYYGGNFLDDERSGFGRMWHNNGDFYQGSWKNDLYSGSGMLIYANGNRYEGNFLEGKKSGHGTFYHLRTGQMQNGDWKLDVCIRSVMSDMSNRQSATVPTFYPIRVLM